MLSFLESCEGGGCFSDLHRPRDQRHLVDNVSSCLAAEAPYADLKRQKEQQQLAARRHYTAVNNSPSATSATYGDTLTRIEGGRAVTYYGADAARLRAIAPKPHPPRPQTSDAYVNSYGPFRLEDKLPKPTGVRRVDVPRPPAAGKEEISLFGTRSPRTVHKEYHAEDPGWGGDPARDIIFNDPSARKIPTKSERILVVKATIPNAEEEGALDRRNRAQSASARLPKVWRRPVYPHQWMNEEARKDEAVYKSIWTQRRERGQRKQHAEVNLKVNYKRLKGAALSTSSPRYLAEEKRLQETARAGEREQRLEKEWAAREERFYAERQARTPHAPDDNKKRLSSTMRREMENIFKRLEV